MIGAFFSNIMVFHGFGVFQHQHVYGEVSTMGIEPSKFEQFFVPWPCLVAGEGYPKDGTAWDGSNAWHV
jgi:hypothetical protein